MERKRIVIVGSSFAGYTGALELKEKIGNKHDVVVIANSPKFVFIPSLIWYPFGLREEEDISFDVRPVYAEHGIQFIEANVTGFDLDQRLVKMHKRTQDTFSDTEETLGYDYILIATGPKVDFDHIPGLGPEHNSYSICNVEHAEHTKHAWERLLENPGPIIIGASQGAACFGAAYEFVFNVRYQLKKHRLTKRAPITFLTAEPFLAHFGIGGFGSGEAMCERMFKFYDINWRTNTVIKEVTPTGVVLDDGTELPSNFTMIIPRFLGVDAVRNTPGLGNANGFIEVNDAYQHKHYPEVYAAGVAVHVPPPGDTPVPCGVPKTGYPSEQMAKVAVHNIVAYLEGRSEQLETLPFGEIEAYCIMDTGNMGMMILGDHMVGNRRLEFIIPGPQAHWAKLAFEKYFMFTRKRAHV